MQMYLPLDNKQSLFTHVTKKMSAIKIPHTKYNKRYVNLKKADFHESPALWIPPE